MNARKRSPTPGSASWSASTGVTPTVAIPRAPCPAWRSSTPSSGRYEDAIASSSHSSPNGQVPKPST